MHRCTYVYLDNLSRGYVKVFAKYPATLADHKGEFTGTACREPPTKRIGTRSSWACRRNDTRAEQNRSQRITTEQARRGEARPEA